MPETQFASAERASSADVQIQFNTFSTSPLLNDFLSKIDQYILVLNHQRQIVYANSAFLKDFDIGDISAILGRRVGEVFDCRFAWCVAGCGTSEFCRECGAVRSMLGCLDDKKDNYMECVILTKSSKTIELGVTSKYIEINGEPYDIFSLDDLSREKELKTVEDILFHDIANIASGMHSMLQLLYDERVTDKKKIHAQLTRCSSELLEELSSHKMLKSAERKELQVKNATHNSLCLIDNAVRFAERTSVARGNILYVYAGSADFDIVTDSGLFNRVLVNMLTNALEASTFSQKVTVGCEIKGREKVFWVHNSSYMPVDIQTKIFRQTFSTKKRGSGYGTQSIRLITEGYLGGRVDFSSDAEDGTYFRIYFPAK